MCCLGLPLFGMWGLRGLPLLVWRVVNSATRQRRGERYLLHQPYTAGAVFCSLVRGLPSPARVGHASHSPARSFGPQRQAILAPNSRMLDSIFRRRARPQLDTDERPDHAEQGTGPLPGQRSGGCEAQRGRPPGARDEPTTSGTDISRLDAAPRSRLALLANGVARPDGHRVNERSRGRERYCAHQNLVQNFGANSRGRGVTCSTCGLTP